MFDWVLNTYTPDADTKKHQINIFYVVLVLLLLTWNKIYSLVFMDIWQISQIHVSIALNK